MSDILKCSSLGNWNRSWILKSTPVLAKPFYAASKKPGSNQIRSQTGSRIGSRAKYPLFDPWSYPWSGSWSGPRSSPWPCLWSGLWSSPWTCPWSDPARCRFCRRRLSRDATCKYLYLVTLLGYFVLLLEMNILSLLYCTFAFMPRRNSSWMHILCFILTRQWR